MNILSIREGIDELNNGEIIAYPTEGVYGIGCNARNLKSVIKIAELKQRPIEKGMIILISDLKIIKDWIVGLPEEEIKKLYTEYSGYTYTWLLPKSLNCPYEVSGDSDCLAVRITQHPVAKALCLSLNAPLISTSANPQSLPSAKTVEEVSKYFNGKISGIVSGEVGSLRDATRIQNIKTDQFIRI